MFGRRKCFAMNSALMFLGVCSILLPTNWVVEGLSDFRLCADPQCQSIISLATAKITYRAGEEGMASFKINSIIRVKSKSAGKDLNLWGIEVNGREGYAPKDYILEEKVIVKDKDLTHIVPVILPGSQKMYSTASPTPATIKPSENIPIKKEDVELTTTAPLMTYPESEQIIPLTKADREPTKEEIRQSTPEQSEIEMIHGTAIPVLGKVDEKHDDLKPNTNSDKSEVSEKDYLENSSETTKFEEQVLEPEQIVEVVQEPNTSKPEETKATESGSPTLDTADNDGNVEDVEDAEDDYDEEEDNNDEEEEGDPIVDKIDKEQSLSDEELIKKESNDSKTLHVEAEHLNAQNSNQTEQTDNSLIGEKLNLQKSNEEENQKEPSAGLLSDIANAINEFVGTETTTEQPQTQLPVPQESVSVEVPPLSTSEISNENGKKVPSDISERQQVPNTLAETTPSEFELQANVFTEATTQSPSVTTAEEKVVDNILGDEYKVPSLPIFQTPTKYTPQHQYKQEHQHSHQYHQHKDHHQHLDPSTSRNNIPEAPHDTTTKTKSVISQQSGDEKLHIPYYSPSDVEPTPKQLQTDTNSDEKVTELSREEIQSEKFETLAPSPYNYSKNNEFTDESDGNIAPVKKNEESDHKIEKNGQRNHVDASTVEENSHKDDGGAKKNSPNSTPLPPNETTTSAFHPPSVEYEATTTMSHSPQVEYETTTTAPHPPKEEYEATTIMSHPPQEEYDTTTTASHPPKEKYDTTTTASHPPKEEYETTTIMSHPPQGEYDTTTIAKEEYETTSTAPHLPREEYDATTTVPHLPSEEYEATTIAPHNMQDEVVKEKEQGLFATILGTVNNFLSNGKKEDEGVEDEELQRILYPDRVKSRKKSKEDDADYCEKLSPNDCPTRVLRELNNAAASSSSIAGCQLDLNNMSMDMLLTVAGNKMFEMSELLACLVTVAVTCLFFLFVYYCFCNSSREGELLAKLNALERSLLATHKENAILKEDLMGTRNKLSSIEDNSFGSNDMVIALKKELEEELLEKRQLQEQVGNLEKELENAAEAGLELNKIVSELLNNQTGDESIISSVEELQKQLNEQQKTILDINANLAEKSRENSELQLMIAEQNARLSGEIASLQQDNDELEVEKSNLQTRLEEAKREFEEDITKALEGKNFEIKRLQSELVELSTKVEAEHTKYQTSMAKVEALEECLRTVRRDPSVNINNLIDVANVRAELLDLQKRYAALKERLDTETDGKKLFEQQLQLASSENEKLKHDFHQSEKDKLEAQTRLEVLSNYFKEKETQLQKELSLKEAMWLKQQGETTSTVDRVTTMQEEIQALKSQNDALRAEIEAQLAAHKAQTGTLENRAHETWLAARQSERRYEEARAEATALRRKLTSLAGGGATGEANFEKMAAAGELNNAPSPIHMESPGSPLLGRLPPPPFLPPPFMGPPPPFMGMPPPFVPPGEMRPPPLGRLMSPPPGAVSGGSGGRGHLPPPRSCRYSPNRTDYDDYDDDEDEDDYVNDEDEEEERMRPHHRRRGSDVNGSWQRDDSYSPPPRAYRSQSPTDSRYNYNAERDLISTYDTETDFEPSPRKHDRRGARGPRAGSYRDYSPPPSASSPLNVSANSNPGKKHSASAFNKGHMSSGSEKSATQWWHKQ